MGGRLLGPGWGLGPPQAGSAARRGSLSQALPCGGRGWGLVRPQVPGGGRTGPAAAAPQTPRPCIEPRGPAPRPLACVCFRRDRHVLSTSCRAVGRLSGSASLRPVHLPTAPPGVVTRASRPRLCVRLGRARWSPSAAFPALPALPPCGALWVLVALPHRGPEGHQSLPGP